VNVKIKNLIAKKLANQCTSEDLSDLGHWTSLSDRNLKKYKQFELAWKYSGKAVANPEAFNADRAWKKMEQRIQRYENQENTFAPKRNLRARLMPVMMRVAAVLVIAVGAWFMLQQESTPVTHTIAADANLDEAVVLPDGTRIFLNQGSQLSYTDGFNDNSRSINFEGEAYFEIAANPEKPFIITTQNLGIKVLGTSFNLSSNKQDEQIELHLQSGKVLVYSVDEQGKMLEQLQLNPGEMATFTKSSGMLKRDEIQSANHLAWKTGVLEFHNTPLTEVIEELSKTYNLNFVAEHNCNNLMLTARFENESAESILQTLEFVFNLNISDQGDHFLIQ
jgi:transmembrane sensor